MQAPGGEQLAVLPGDRSPVKSNNSLIIIKCPGVKYPGWGRQSEGRAPQPDPPSAQRGSWLRDVLPTDRKGKLMNASPRR